jgi:two-component system chemotaxis sensor kinase CheA
VAIEKALLTKEEASVLSEEEIFSLITQPGFSTSRVVTQTSGRGVGMNAVRSAVESIGGTLKITSAPGRGSTFTLKLPLMLAIVQALLVKVSDETYAIPMANIIETMKAKSETVKRLESREVVPYRETILPLIRLGEEFGRGERTAYSVQRPPQHAAGPPRSLAETEESLNAERSTLNAGRNGSRISLVVIELGRQRAGLVVDDLLTQQEVVIKSTAGRLRAMKGIAGATILGDGRVAMVLDVASILQRPAYSV